MSDARSAIKKLIAEEYQKFKTASGTNTLGIVNDTNADGTVNVLDSTGAVTAATPLYPCVKGQKVILMAAGGTFKCAPITPNAPNVPIIIPPFFSGGLTRFAVGHQFGDIPGQNEMAVDFQDKGSNQIFRLTFPDLPIANNWTFAGSGFVVDTQIDGSLNGIVQPFHQFSNFFPFAFSEDGAAFAIAFNQLGSALPFDSPDIRGYKIRLYKIGTTMKSAGVIDPVNQIVQLSATLIQEVNGTCAQNTQSLAIDPPTFNGFVAYQELRIQMSLFVTKSVASDGTTSYKIYWMDLFRRKATLTSVSAFPGLLDIGFTCVASPPNNNNNSTFSNLYLSVFVNRLDGGLSGIATLLYELIIDLILIYDDPNPGGGTNFWSFLKFVPIAIVDVVDNLSRVRILGILPQIQNIENNFISNLNYDSVPSQYVLMDTPGSGPACASVPFPNPPFGAGNYSGLFQALTPVYLSPFVSPGLVFENSGYFQPLVSKNFSCILIPDGNTPQGFRAFGISRKDGSVVELPFTPPPFTSAPGGEYGLLKTADSSYLYLVQFQPPAPPGSKHRAEIFTSKVVANVVTAQIPALIITPSGTPPQSVKSITLGTTFPFSDLLTMMSTQ